MTDRDSHVLTRRSHLGYRPKTEIREKIPSNAPTSSPLAPSHAAAPAGEASEPEREPIEQQHRPGGNRVRSAGPRPSASSGRVTRIQVGTSSARTSAAKKPLAAPQHRALNEAHRPQATHLPSTDNSGDVTASPERTWESAAARQPHTPTPTPTLQKTGDRESSHTEGPGTSTAFPLSTLPTSPIDNSGDTPPPTPPTDNTGDVTHQRGRSRPKAAKNTQASSATQEPIMDTPGANLEAMANLQADELQKIIKSLQGIAASRTGTNTPTAPQPPHIPAATT